MMQKGTWEYCRNKWRLKIFSREKPKYNFIMFRHHTGVYQIYWPAST